MFGQSFTLSGMMRYRNARSHVRMQSITGNEASVQHMHRELVTALLLIVV
jgi:hypothetical protein